MTKILFFFLFSLMPLAAQVIYKGDSKAENKKHIVFVVSDHEYRAEETCTALARILAKHHGYSCTVLYGVNGKGEITAGASNIKGLKALKKADLMVIFTRFLDLPDKQMRHIDDYLKRGGPVVGMRTSSHAFKIPKGKKYSKYDFKSDDPTFLKGFGHQILGNTWVGHYGKNHVQGTRIEIIPEQKDHVILKGVNDHAFCHAGGYNGIADESFTVLTNSQPLLAIKKEAAPDPKKKPVPSTWTRHYTTKNGKKARVFHSTQGASEDLLDTDYRRMMINGIFWAIGDEVHIKADNNVDFVGKYQPRTFKLGQYAKGVKPADLKDMNSPIMPVKGNLKKQSHNKKNKPNADDSKKDLSHYYINSKSSPRPKKVAARKTKLPLNIKPNTRIALVGNLLLDGERRHGHLETLIHQHLPQHELEIRNFAWPGDEVNLRPRPGNLGDLQQYLLYYKTDLIIAAFGYNESFAGKRGLATFKKNLDQFLADFKTRAFNGKTAPQIVLLSPVANENITNLPAADRNNKNILLYANVLKKAARKHGVAYIDVLKPTLNTSTGTTTDGNALNAKGHAQFANAAVSALFKIKPPKLREDLRKLVVDKASQFERRYRPLNTFYYVGGRSKSYGYLDFLPAMRNFDYMVKARNKAIHTTARTGTLTQPDDSGIPQLEPVKLARGANKFLSPAEELKAFQIDPRVEVNCFASEEDFPELACPISMRWDAKGRLWVSTSVAYPHLYPGQKPMDKIIILEDTDNDGKADKCTTWADDLHIPLSFVLDGNGGVYCSEQPHLTHLTDRDGDGKMDHREILLTGFGCEDSHHSIHDLIWTPGGDLLFRESVFHHSQVETAYGPVRARNSSWFLYNLKNKKLTAFGAYPNTNPWGVSFDKWGNHIASHPVFASSFHATNPAYPKQTMPAGNGFTQEIGQHPKAPKGMQAYSGVCGHGFIDFPQWPAEMQGGFIKNRYKPTNNVEFHSYNYKEDHFAESKQANLIFSKNLSFIPVDFQVGPTGAAYICDWYNPVKGHAQYSLRDPRRDRKAGRIWRIVPKGFEPLKKPNFDDATIEQLLTYLTAKQYKIRHWAKRELRARDHKEVVTSLDKWQQTQTDEATLLEILWLRQGIDAPDFSLLQKLIRSERPLIAAAAFGPLRFWHNRMEKAAVSKLLRSGAEHSSQHVRREAVICASYVGTRKAFSAIQPVLSQPAGVHLGYAVKTSFESEALRKYWSSNTAARLKTLKKEGNNASKQDKRTAAQRRFDKKKNLKVVKISCVPERIMFDKKSFKVKAGQPVKLTLNNPDATAHNLLILEKNTPIQEIGMKATEMARDPNAAKKGYIPRDSRILHHTKLLQEHSSETLRFIAPKAPGEYPFVCTFPGHWTVMKGIMIVE